MQLKRSKCGLHRTPRIASLLWKEWMLVSLSLVYWVFTIFVPIPSKQQTRARYDAICVQECRNFNIWGYALRSKRFEGSRLYSKIIWGLQATKRRGSGLYGKSFRAPGLRPPPTFGTLFSISISYWESIETLCNARKTACLLAALVSDPVQLPCLILF